MTAGRESKIRYSFRRLVDDLRHYRMEIVGLLVVCWGLAAVAAILDVSRGAVISAFSDRLWDWFGIGALAVAVAIVGAGVMLIAEHRRFRSASYWPRIGGLGVMWLCCLVVGDAFSVDAAYSPGGRAGGLIGATARAAGGPALQWLLVLALLLVGTHLSLGLSLRRTGRFLAAALARGARGAWQSLRQSSSAPRRPSDPGQPPRTVPVAEARRMAELQEDALAVDHEEPRDDALPATSGSQGSTLLPPIDVFDPPTGDPGSEPDDGLQSAIIEETLASFGIPAKVAEVQRGPAVTRFGVEPGYFDQSSGGSLVRRKVRVNKIKSLTDDLALALAAAPIRVEAPIPGRPLVGVEVPNSAVAVVGIRTILESPEFREGKGGLRVALGRDISGRPAVVSLERMPHLLIAGATGSGKSACIGALLASLLYACTPAQLRLLLIDPKQVELTRYRGVPHLLGNPETQVDGAVAALRWACKQMDERYKLFAQAGARDLKGYNERSRDGGEPLPWIVIVIDELADLMLTAPDEVEKSICRLAQMARATGIHLVLSTQRPSVDVVTGLIKANFPARIAFAVTTQTDSRVIIDATGADSLIGRGDMLYMAPDANKLVRLQGTYVTEDETRRLIEFWRAHVPDGQPQAVCPWSGILDDEEEDPLLGEAAVVAREVETISSSYLQRRLRIGYPRAARLLTELEVAGVVVATKGGYKAVKDEPEEDISGLVDEDDGGSESAE